MAEQILYPSYTLLDGVSVTRGRIDSVYARMVIAAVTVGIVFVLSASFPLADRTLHGGYSLYFLYRQLFFAGLGLIGLVAMILIPLQMVSSTGLLVVGALVGAAAMVACRVGPFADPAGGSFCWLKLSSTVRIQPSEFVKVLYVVMLARILAGPTSATCTRNMILGRVLLAMSGFCLLLLFQKDLGMSLLVVGLTLGMLFLGGYRLWQIAGLAAVAGLTGVGYAHSSPVRWDRITSFMDPVASIHGGGFQLCQMMGTLARGGIGGLGLGMSPDKWGGLPAPHTDSIFCVMGAELGLVGGVMFLGLVMWMMGRGLRIAQRAAFPTGWYTACGIALLLGLQSLINIGVATVSIPCTGLTLPFISFGGSSLVSSMVAAGIMLGISRYSAVERDE